MSKTNGLIPVLSVREQRSIHFVPSLAVHQLPCISRSARGRLRHFIGDNLSLHPGNGVWMECT